MIKNHTKELKAYEEALRKDFELGDGIRHEGTQIVLPEALTIPNAIRALEKHQESMEEDSAKQISLVGHPSESLVAVYNAMVKVFGAVWGGASHSFFGTDPGKTLSVRVGPMPEDVVNVPFGKLEIPGLPVQFRINVDNDARNPIESTTILQANYKRMYQGIVDNLEKEIHIQLKEHSIFRGKAVNSRFDFIDLGGFPLEKIVYSVQERHDLEAHVFRLIKSREWAKKRKMSLKRTVLLFGTFGTGKTLTALLCANIAAEHNWTFMNVLPGDDITMALEFAKKYQPGVVFFEDIDQVVGGERNGDVNAILNTVDGILSKNAEVMTILTTNNADRIQPAMLRPGRIDALIELGHVDEAALKGIIEVNVGDMLTEEVDASLLMKSAKDYTPSFLVEAANRAVLYAMERSNGNGEGKITNEDLRFALEGLRAQYRLMTEKREVEKATVEAVLAGMTEKIVEGRLKAFTEESKLMPITPSKWSDGLHFVNGEG